MANDWLPTLKHYLRNKGYALTPNQDCYDIISPLGKHALCNLRWKTKPVWGRIAKRWEWSIPLEAWQRYIQTSVKLLFVFEKSSGVIHCAKLQEIKPDARVYLGDDLDRGGTIFLPTKGYAQVGKIETN